MTKTTSASQCRVSLLFGSFEFLSFDIVSDFGFRASDLKTFHFIRQSHSSLTPAKRDLRLAQRTRFSLIE